MHLRPCQRNRYLLLPWLPCSAATLLYWAAWQWQWQWRRRRRRGHVSGSGADWPDWPDVGPTTAFAVALAALGYAHLCVLSHYRNLKNQAR